MFKKTIITGFAAAAILTAVASGANASQMGPELDFQENQVLVNNPIVDTDELACWGCTSSSTGRIRDGYVQPHYRSNGSFVNGYWRS